MKNFAILSTVTLLSITTFAADKASRNPAAVFPQEVTALASKVKKEVRTRVSAYNVTADEANGCQDAGLHYEVKLQVKKAVRALDKEGNPIVKYSWETVREINTDDKGNPMEICTE